jgi:hypothetical protein
MNLEMEKCVISTSFKGLFWKTTKFGL